MRIRFTRRGALAAPLGTAAVTAVAVAFAPAASAFAGQQRWPADQVGQVDARYLRAERFSVAPEH